MKESDMIKNYDPWVPDHYRCVMCGCDVHKDKVDEVGFSVPDMMCDECYDVVENDYLDDDFDDYDYEGEFD